MLNKQTSGRTDNSNSEESTRDVGCMVKARFPRSQELVEKLQAGELERARCLFESYYRRHFDIIDSEIERWLSRGRKLALWGNGNNDVGNAEYAFRQVFDPKNERFASICKNNPKRRPDKQGYRKTVHYADVADHVIFSLDPAPYNFLKFFYRDGLSPDYVVVENLIWSIPVEEDCRIRLGNAVEGSNSIAEGDERSKTCSLTILYCPKPQVVENIASYALTVGKAYVYDNSPVPDPMLVARLKELPNLEYLSGEGVNSGIGHPVNCVFSLARDAGFEWCFTFDQDSVADSGMISRMLGFALSGQCDDDVALVCPTIVRESAPFAPAGLQASVTYVNKAIQSGLLHCLSACERIGPYEERMFIDEVDNEYCARAHEAGYRIARVNGAALLHQTEEAAVNKAKVSHSLKHDIDKFTAMRFFYRSRNMNCMRDRFAETNPGYAAECSYGLSTLYWLIGKDARPGDEALAVMLGANDFRSGIWRSYEEALADLQGC